MGWPSSVLAASPKRSILWGTLEKRPSPISPDSPSRGPLEITGLFLCQDLTHFISILVKAWKVFIGTVKGKPWCYYCINSVLFGPISESWCLMTCYSPVTGSAKPRTTNGLRWWPVGWPDVPISQDWGDSWDVELQSYIQESQANWGELISLWLGQSSPSWLCSEDDTSDSLMLASQVPPSPPRTSMPLRRWWDPWPDYRVGPRIFQCQIQAADRRLPSFLFISF